MATGEMVSTRTAAASEGRHEHVVPISTNTSAIRVIPQEMLNLLAGGISGMVAKSLVAPIDRIKILYQCTDAQFRLRNVPSVARSIVKTEGFSALWKGNTATMLRVFPYAGVQFMTFDYTKQYFLTNREQQNHQHGCNNNNSLGITPLENVIAGMCAGAASVLCTYPLDLTRAQLAVLMQDKGANNGGGATTTATSTNSSQHQSIRNVFMNNFRERGLAGLFRGITPTMLGIMPYSGIAFTINEQSKNKIRINTDREPTTIEKLQCGAISGVVAQSLTYPLEVTRRRMQTHGLISTSVSNRLLSDSISKETNLAAATFHSPQQQQKVSSSQQQIVSKNTSKSITMGQVMRQLYRQDGIAGFFKGVSMNWMKGPIAFSISFTTYDFVKAWLYKSQQLP